MATSMPEDFTTGKWRPVLGDPTITDPAKVQRILLCSGKIRWELVRERDRLGLNEQVAIVTLERLYPHPYVELTAELARYPQVDDIRWVQDEPRNHGPWEFLEARLLPGMSQMLGTEFNVRVFSRPDAAAASTGSKAIHVQEEELLLHAALTDD